MAFENSRIHYRGILEEIRAAGMWKRERVIGSPQGGEVQLETPEGKAEAALNFCSNNYLGLANHPEVVRAAREILESRGFGMASVRFICGTQDIHRRLERRLASFTGMEDAILYSSCFDANGGLFETLLGPEDVVISDALNHASIIDGIRLAKARRRVYRHSDMDDLDVALAEHAGARVKLIATDGVFSMHGEFARLDEICARAERHGALVMVDDSHATGFVGPSGRGTHEKFGVMERVDIITSTLGKALGGATGGFTAARAEIVELLRQRSRPYLFSNSVAPPVAGASLAVLDLLEREPERRRTLELNTTRFRAEMARRGFQLASGSHPIVPIVVGEEKKALDLAAELNHRGILVVGFTYPVVPRGEARVRVQISAAHRPEDLDRALDAFSAAARALGIIPAPH